MVQNTEQSDVDAEVPTRTNYVWDKTTHEKGMTFFFPLWVSHAYLQKDIS